VGLVSKLLKGAHYNRIDKIQPFTILYRPRLIDESELDYSNGVLRCQSQTHGHLRFAQIANPSNKEIG
jgi:hypothetical protein